MVEYIADFFRTYLNWVPSEIQFFVLVMGIAAFLGTVLRIFKWKTLWISFLLFILVPLLPLIQYGLERLWEEFLGLI